MGVKDLYRLFIDIGAFIALVDERDPVMVDLPRVYPPATAWLESLGEDGKRRIKSPENSCRLSAVSFQNKNMLFSLVPVCVDHVSGYPPALPLNLAYFAQTDRSMPGGFRLIALILVFDSTSYKGKGKTFAKNSITIPRLSSSWQNWLR
ncbi:MAG: hypothetical protein AB1556_06915 [Bacillota bacterium]